MRTSTLKILHGSDLQVGKPFRPRAAEAFRRLAFEVEPHLIVVSGDLTQRAKQREFRAAWEFLQRLPTVPLVVTLGNHDVPLYRVWERVLLPYWHWSREIPRDRDSVARVAGAMIIGLNSASPLRAVVNGRITTRQLAFARKNFEEAAPGGVRVLVIHHPLIVPPGGEFGAPLPGARRILQQIEDMEVDVVLGGHMHVTHLATSRDLIEGEGAGVPLITAGTTTSRRGRGHETRRNSTNVIEVLDDYVNVTPYYFESRGTAFEPSETISLARPGMPALEPPMGLGGT
ncbi:MAG TPA: 3',5'-cyclic-nucleotide phosphodiesterase [Gemmatimonadetes bacterium]|nr:3',5'-cyclic-nucleotide phosphodiesterase [Gemmatimonadota bacterium]